MQLLSAERLLGTIYSSITKGSRNVVNETPADPDLSTRWIRSACSTAHSRDNRISSRYSARPPAIVVKQSLPHVETVLVTPAKKAPVCT